MLFFPWGMSQGAFDCMTPTAWSLPSVRSWFVLVSTSRRVASFAWLWLEEVLQVPVPQISWPKMVSRLSSLSGRWTTVSPAAEPFLCVTGKTSC